LPTNRGPVETQSATTTFTRAVTVADGVYAPGHLGELTQYLPFGLVDDVLAETRTVQRRLRVLPPRAGVYFVLALGLLPHLGYAPVWGKLTAGLAGLLHLRVHVVVGQVFTVSPPYGLSLAQCPERRANFSRE
jgi:hypothetical protein